MDTPDKNQIRTPISKFEDSPVYNYINSLSPIKSVKSLTISNTLNSLSFASPPSVFSSPQVSAQKDSKFLRRYHFSGYSRPDLSSENRIRSSSGLGVTDAAQVSECSADQLETFDPKSCIREDTVDATNGNLELPIELPRTLSYDCGSPEGNQAPSHCIKTNSMSVMSDTQAALSQSFKEDTLERSLSFQNKMELPGTCQFEQNKEEEEAGCDWENLISDAADLLLFDTSKNEEASCVQDQNLVDPGSCSFTSLLLPKDASDGEIHNTQTIVQVDSCREHEAENPPAKSVEVENRKEINQTPLLVSSTFQNKQHANLPNEEIDEKAESHIHFGQKQRGIRRRCLVFDSAGAQKKKLEDDSNSSSSVSSQSGEKFASEDKQLVPFRRCTSSSPCILPSIGLHLNALAATTKDPRVVKHETLASGKELISMPSSMTSFNSLSSEQNPSSKALVLNSLKTDMDPASNEVQVMQNVSRVSAFDVNEDFSESPKKKRRRMEHAGESESCKRCNCKKSKCLKLYCECFAAGVYCVEPCSCLECFNKPIHEDTVLATRKQIESRNPLAFAPKVIRSSEPVPEIGEVSNKTPASARHKRGCNCKKSGCLKKYCECYQGGVGCSINCRCGSCKNPFGVKDGFTSMGIEEAGQEEIEAHEKDGLNRNFQRNEVCKEEVQHSDNTLPLTFSFQICRTSVQLPFSSFGKPPRSPMLPQRKSAKHFQISPDDETPEILRGNSSPISGVKTASPNSKRVSPPHGQLSSSPGMRSSRKLVLQSIPSFPSLTQLQNGDFK